VKNILKVLRFFFANPGQLFICAEVSRALSLPERNVSNYLKTLTDEGFIRREARAYRLSESIVSGSIRSLKSITGNMR